MTCLRAAFGFDPQFDAVHTAAGAKVPRIRQVVPAAVEPLLPRAIDAAFEERPRCHGYIRRLRSLVPPEVDGHEERTVDRHRLLEMMHRCHGLIAAFIRHDVSE